MKSTFKLFILLFAFSSFAGAQGLPNNFRQLLNKAKMQFTMPPGFKATPVLDNGDVVYDFAVKSNTSGLEIRYRIWPIDMTVTNPNALFEPMLITMGLNISGGKMVQPQRYPDESVKEEFGADAGCTSAVPVNSDFGKGYTKCMFSAIHKDNVADAYIFYLFDNQDEIMSALTTERVFHALKFK